MGLGVWILIFFLRSGGSASRRRATLWSPFVALELFMHDRLLSVESQELIAFLSADYDSSKFRNLKYLLQIK